MLPLNDGYEHTDDVDGEHVRAHWCGPKLWVLRDWPSGRTCGARASSYAQACQLTAFLDSLYRETHTPDQGAQSHDHHCPHR